MSVQRISGVIVDVLNRAEFPGTIEISAGKVRRIIRDAKPRGRHLLMPGLVDAHIHIESSLLPPAEFARHAVVHGTVATVSDPHEIANVLGESGVRYMIADGKRTPFKFNFGAPSCVPATTFETAGAKLDAAAVGRLLRSPDIKFLAEVMNFPGVLNGDPQLRTMIATSRKLGKPVDGHAPGLRGEIAARYAAAGITTDHECFTLGEGRDKLAAGMEILIREGSAARNFAALAPLLRTHAEHCMFCCDDLHSDLLMQRHLEEHIRRALALGVDRFDVLRCATLNPIRHYGLDVGLLRAGDPADFIEVDGWRNFRVRRTWIDGRLVASGGRSRLPRQPSWIVNKFRARVRRADDFAVPMKRGTINVIQALNGQLVTRRVRLRARIVNGCAVADPARDLLKIAVVNRYAAHAPVAVGFIRGFGLKAGAISSSVAHDSHNVVVVGADDASLATAVNLIVAHRGGLSAVGRGRRAILPLPIAGLMSNLDGRTVARRYTTLDAQAKKMGSHLDAPFMTLSFMALLVIPDLKLSDRGLFSAASWNFLPLSGG